MSSTRLPGKVLRKVLDKPLLEFQLERLRRVKGVDTIVIATSVNSSDDEIESFCKSHAVVCHRGSEQDVLSRYYDAAKSVGADIVVRITADCPLIDPEVTGDVIEFFKKNKYDYVTNTIPRTFPRGLDTEVFSFSALKKSHENAKEPSQREHVTSFIYNSQELFTVGSFVGARDHSAHRWTVDTPEDFDLIEKIIAALYPVNREFRLSDVITTLEKNPSWSTINAHIEQKTGETKTVVIRTDASEKIGTGHVIRCLTLAEALRASGYQVLFASKTETGDLCAYVESKGFKVLKLKSMDAEETLLRIKEIAAPVEFLVVDHYSIDKNWEAKMRPHVGKIAVIDDLADRDHDCDLVLDQNYAESAGQRYANRVAKNTAKLMGPEYALLRRDFQVLRQKTTARSGTVKNILVFFGGIDLTDETSKTLSALKMLKDVKFEIDVVVGSKNPHLEKVRELVKTVPGAKLHVQTEKMAELMAAADLCIGAGGTATWERFCLGLPSICICIADNQREFLEVLAKNGYLIDLGDASDVTSSAIGEALKKLISDPATLAAYSKKSMNLVDGFGVHRVVQAIRSMK